MNSRLAPSVATLNGFEIADIDDAVGRAKHALGALRDASIFMTGGTGFFGQWLLALIARANATQSLGIRVTVLTRNAAGFRRRCAELARGSLVQLLEGDVRSFDLPTGRFSHLIHAATDTSADADRRPLELTDTIVGGTRHTLDFALSSGVGRTLIVSSGAIYGAQPHDVLNLPEDFLGAGPTTNSRSTYGNAKRLAEQIAAVHSKDSGIPTVVARAFAFIGPALPLDTHFAIGNFIRDAIAGNVITVKGDGSPFRSYLYAGDLAVWLLQLLVHGRAGEAYNVGSDRAISIAELAALVASILPTARGVAIEGTPAPAALRSRYIPSIERARQELALDVWTPLDEAIRRTARWAERQRAQATPVPR
jgi:dTDP-glucose 4,6-dehydratase